MLVRFIRDCKQVRQGELIPRREGEIVDLPLAEAAKAIEKEFAVRHDTETVPIPDCPFDLEYDRL